MISDLERASISHLLLDWLSAYLGHDGTLAAQIFVTKTEEIVDDESLVTITD